MAEETPPRYCSVCRHELKPEDYLSCPKCGTPLILEAHVPTPEADRAVPPLPQPDTGSPGAPAQEQPAQEQLTQRGWWRRHPILSGGLGIIAVLLVFISVVGSLGGDGRGENSAKGGADQEHKKSTSGGKPRFLPEIEDIPLSPGEYRTGEYEPSFSFRVGKGWSLGGEAFQASLQLKRRDVSESGWLLFANVHEVYKPGTQGQIVAAPKDLVGWYQHHPYLQTTKPEPISVGGVKGVQFDVVVKDLPKDYNGECGSDCVDIIRAGTAGVSGHAWVWEKEKQRTIVLEDFEGGTVTIIYAFLAPEFDEMAPEAQRVIDSVKWRETG